jgi:hypothetical protein
MKCTFQVGQKVVCIKDNWRCMLYDPATRIRMEMTPPSPSPKRGEIYTIASIEAPDWATEVFVTLKEMSASGFFTASCFRPLQDRPKEADTDISVFTRLLNVREKEDV